MAKSTLTIQLDSSLKDEASKVVEQYGLDLPTVLRMFLTQIASTHAIPLSLDNEQPNEESLAALREKEEMIARGLGESYSCGRDLIWAALE